MKLARPRWLRWRVERAHGERYWIAYVAQTLEGGMIFRTLRHAHTYASRGGVL